MKEKSPPALREHSGLILIEFSQGYCASLSTLGERLEAQGGYDFEI